MKHHSVARLVSMAVVGAGVAAAIAALGFWQVAATAGWIAASLVYLVWVWAVIGRTDAQFTRSHATAEEPARAVADSLLVVIIVASLASVAFVLIPAASAEGVERGVLAALALASIALSWTLLHTLFTLRYARLYYRGENEGGIDFNQPDSPRYSDFAYFSFTLGMTFQVSDTNISEHAIRATVLRHALLSFVFGTVILATTINLVAGLGH
jgi:uncharacterized membrane protein